jgi:hypothetical protein
VVAEGRPRHRPEEAVASSVVSPLAWRLFGDRGNPRLASDEATVADIFRRLRGVAELVYGRGPAEGRMKGRGQGKAKRR